MRLILFEKNTKSKGFTLLELMIVLVIIGLLAGIIGPNLFKNLEKSEKTTAKSQIDALTKAIDQYRIDNGSFPDTSSGLNALLVVLEMHEGETGRVIPWKDLNGGNF
ncbi:type II secretion system protein GspG [Acinetobacter gyllenbergii]|uniref:type II secretion system protein GspG n=1 Tax=Acinetobacter gyllenbergii TaxID=134534 RepID=UPI002B3FFCBE|nr:type II secretion system protein GspG [Acinetobacter gyllenbergii]